MTTRRLHDRWILAEPIAAGGMGTLHRGYDERTGEAVAIKLLKPAHADDYTLTQRFHREAMTLARLSHPAILTMRDFGRDGSDLFMVLDLVAGETLERVIAREGTMTAERALPVLSEILDALAVCHEHDVVHRDVKPANVMLAGGRVKLIDFGLAKVGGQPFEKLTETGTVHGTPHYMAPEQCRGEDVGPAADVYSVGVLSYEMLAGRTPFTGNDAATFMAQHLFVEPAPLANVSPGIAAAVQSALTKRPEDRPTARALRDALNEAIVGADPVTRGNLAAARRVETLGQPREERALGTAGGAVHAREAHAVVWLPAGERSGAVLGCLGTAGIRCKHATSEALPEAPGVLVTSGIERVRRAREKEKRTPIVVIDVGGPEETAEAIRAGADDMLLRGAADADLVAKVRRLARRLRA